MSNTETLVLWLLNLLAAAGVVAWLWHYFSPAAREQRRRDRNHGRVVSRRHGPSVRLAVEAEKPKKHLLK